MVSAGRRIAGTVAGLVALATMPAWTTAAAPVPSADVDPAAPRAAAVLVPVVAASGVAGLPLPMGPSPLPTADPDESVGPSSSSAPEARLPPVGAALDPDRVAAELRPLLRGGALGGGRTPAHVVDVATGTVLYSARDDPTVPASTVKLVTAVSVLQALGADATLRTRTLILDPDAGVPRVVIVGGGDPSLATSGSRVGRPGTSLRPATVRQLARATARELRSRGIARVRVGYDASLFQGPAVHSTWGSSFPSSGIVAPVSALQVDAGRSSPTSVARVADPAGAAARAFAEVLTGTGITVSGKLREVEQRAQSVDLALVESPPVGVLVERMLGTSDNDYAEALARVAAQATGHPGSFDGVAERAAQVLASLGVGVPGDRVADGSGLSRDNALTPGTLTAVLRSAAIQGFGSLSSGLPVAGATGSLRLRFDTATTADGRGLVRGKTGTLTGVLGLAGFASRPDGRLLAFAFLDDTVTGAPSAGRTALDRAAASLVSCDCAG